MDSVALNVYLDVIYTHTGVVMVAALPYVNNRLVVITLPCLFFWRGKREGGIGI